MNRTKLFGALSVTAVLAAVGAPTPAQAGDYVLGATLARGAVVTGPLDRDVQTLSCNANIRREDGIHVPGTPPTDYTDPGADVVIDECVLKVDGVVWLSSPGLVTGRYAHTQPVTAPRPRGLHVEACVSAHATLSSGEVLTTANCFFFDT